MVLQDLLGDLPSYTVPMDDGLYIHKRPRNERLRTTHEEEPAKYERVNVRLCSSQGKETDQGDPDDGEDQPGDGEKWYRLKKQNEPHVPPSIREGMEM